MDVFAPFVAFLVAALPLSVAVTKAVDFLRNLVDGDDSLPKVTWNVVAFAVGVGLAVGWQFNLMVPLIQAVPALAHTTRLTGVAGQVLTGLAIGGMAGFWHEKLDSWSASAK